MLHSESSQLWWVFCLVSSYAYKQLPEVVYFIHVARVSRIGFFWTNDTRIKKSKIIYHKSSEVKIDKTPYWREMVFCLLWYSFPKSKVVLEGDLTAWHNAQVGAHSCRKWFLVFVARVSTHKWLFLFLTWVGIKHLAPSAPDLDFAYTAV